MRRFALLCVLALSAVAARAAETEVVTIEDPVLNARYQAMIKEVRCLVCESRSIAESPSDVAQDLKKLIRDMMLDGASDAEIADFLAARYGDSILYRPPLQPNTWLLWGSPVLLFVLGAFVFARIVRTRTRQPIDFEEDELE